MRIKMSDKEILRENGKIKAKVVYNGYDVSFLTMLNGWQWTGQPMNPELAKLAIEVLQEYLDKGL